MPSIGHGGGTQRNAQLAISGRPLSLPFALHGLGKEEPTDVIICLSFSLHRPTGCPDGRAREWVFVVCSSSKGSHYKGKLPLLPLLLVTGLAGG